MFKKLAVNSNPLIRTYATHGFFQAVVSANDKITYQDEEAAILEIADYNPADWKQFSQKLTTNTIENELHFYPDKWNQEMNSVLIRECKENDRIEITIKKQIYAAPFSEITLFLTNNSISEIENSPTFNLIDKGIRLGNFSKDGIIKAEGTSSHTILLHKPEYPIHLTMVKNGNEIIGKYKSGNENKSFTIKELNEEEKISNIGVGVRLGSNCFYEWLFSNYINLYYRKIDPIKLDFITNSVKDYHNITYNYFIDANIDTEDEIKKLGFTLKDYIKKQIDLGRYVYVRVNDNINFGVPDTSQKYFHQNLIYGYDDEKGCFYNLYYDYGIIKKCQYTYENFESERNQTTDRDVYVFKYNPGYETYTLNKKNVLNEYKEFLAGNCFTHPSPVLNEADIVMGINSFKKMTTDEEVETVARDVRISHTLYEFAICSTKRVEYYFYKKLISFDYYNILNSLSSQLENACLNLRNSILRMRLRKNYNYEKIKQYMVQIYEIEKSFAETMVLALSN